RFVLIAAVVMALRYSELWAVSLGVGLLEAAVIVLGVKVACSLIDLRFAMLAGRTLRGFAWGLGCGAIAAAGRTASMSAGLNGLPVLAVALATPAVLLVWQQGGKVRDLMMKGALEAS